jgi:hypothetical protein
MSVLGSVANVSAYMLPGILYVTPVINSVFASRKSIRPCITSHTESAMFAQTAAAVQMMVVFTVFLIPTEKSSTGIAHANHHI